MVQVKTAKGKYVDMGVIAQNHEKDKAIGNVPMNARGDKLDKRGNIIRTHEEVEETQKEELAKEEKPVEKSSSKRTQKSRKKPQEPTVVREEPKTRDDGTTYVEVEYSDGSIAIVESRE